MCICGVHVYTWLMLYCLTPTVMHNNMYIYIYSVHACIYMYTHAHVPGSPGIGGLKGGTGRLRGGFGS